MLSGRHNWGISSNFAAAADERAIAFVTTTAAVLRGTAGGRGALAAPSYGGIKISHHVNQINSFELVQTACGSRDSTCEADFKLDLCRIADQ